MAITLKIVNGDYVETDDGQFSIVEGADCTKQCITENLMVNPTPNGFGAGIGKLVGTIARDELSMQMVLTTTIMRSFKRMRDLQKFPSNTPYLSNEIIYSGVVVAFKAVSSLRRYLYSVRILTEAGRAITAKGQIPF